MTLEEAIQNDVQRISKVVAELKMAATEPGINQAPALAQYLSQFYTGLESCLEKKFKLVKIQLPGKSNQYHKDLLTLAIESKLVPENYADFLDDLLTFRHFARHGYGAEFRVDEVRDKAANTEKAWTELKPILEGPLPDGIAANWMKKLATLHEPNSEFNPKPIEQIHVSKQGG